jgi:hypothetical protein
MGSSQKLMLLVSLSFFKEGWTEVIVFNRINTGIVGSNPTWGMNVCSVFMLSCVQVGALRRADPPSKESYRLCKRLKNLKSDRSRTKGCRSIDR